MQTHTLHPAIASPALSHGSGLVDSVTSPNSPLLATISQLRHHHYRTDNLFSGVSLDHPADKAVIPLIKRTLCPDGPSLAEPGAQPLPPLTSSNEVDLQLYAFLAIVMREFVISWYTKITPDREFVDEVIQLVAHITRALEERIRRVDLVQVLLDEVPALFKNHIDAYRTARAVADDKADPNTLHQIYHSINPHPALSPIPTSQRDIDHQSRNEASWRRLVVEGILGVLLPTEDLKSPAFRTLVTEILAETVLRNGLDRASQGFVLWEGISNSMSGAPKREMKPPFTTLPSPESADQCPPRQQVVRRRRRPQNANKGGHIRSESMPEVGSLNLTEDNGTQDVKSEGLRGSTGLTIRRIVWSIAHALLTVVVTIHGFVLALLKASSLPQRRKVGKMKTGWRDGSSSLDNRAAPPIPVLSMSIWSCVNTLVQFDRRAPWLAGLLSFGKWALCAGPRVFLSRDGSRLCESDGLLDRLLIERVSSAIYAPELLPKILRAARMAVFPNNSPGLPRPPDPSLSEQKDIQTRCARAIIDSLPLFVVARIAGTAVPSVNAHSEAMSQVSDMLAVLEDPYLNKHFIFSLVEVLVSHVLPELEEGGVSDVLIDRLGRTGP